MPHHVAELRGRGLLVSADVAKTWDAQARLAVATTLVRRWIGGRLRMRQRKDAPASAAWALWFHGGVSRFVARELLLELGLLTPDEYRAELDSIELMLATSPLRDRPLSELVARVDDPDPRVAVDARASLVARGVMYATWIDARLRASPSHETIGELLGMVVALAVVDNVSELTLGQWLSHVRGFLWEDDPRADFESVVVRGERPKLRKGALGPCFRARSAKLRRFELGFFDGSVAGVRRALMLDPRGPAAKAGVRADDEIVELSYDDGDATAEVSVTVTRGQADRTIRYRPAGPPLSGTRWMRVAGVSDERCVR